MASTVINTRADLDALAGTPAHDAFMAMLAGTLYRLEKDDTAGTWRAVEDDSTIARFGFTRADFPSAEPPALPAYEPPTPEVFVCTPWQIRKALNAMNLRQDVEAAVLASPDQSLKDGWEFATAFRSDDPFVVQMGAALGKTEAETLELIKMAATL